MRAVSLLAFSSEHYIPCWHFTSNATSCCVTSAKGHKRALVRAHLEVTNHVEDLYITLPLPDTSPFKWERNGGHKLSPETAQSIGCASE